MQRARARNTPRQDFAAFGDKRSQQLHVLVVDVVDLVRAELAHLAAPEHRTALALLLFLVLLVGAAATATRASLSKWHRLSLQSIEAVVIHVVSFHRAAFARLTLRRQTAF